ncbi:MAG: hypothetical protein IIA45_03510 [Bacteroidetes bacterium]|nr:hypothetical protein [Bacteroidota bacterium]
MKLLSLPLILFIILYGCGNQQTENTDTKSEVLETVEIEEGEIAEESEQIEEPSPHFELLSQLEGTYFILTEEFDGYYYEEPCGFVEFDVKIVEVSEYSDNWEIYLPGDYGEYYTITSAEEKNEGIYITATEEVEGEVRTWAFLPNPAEYVWEFITLGLKYNPQIVKAENLEEFEIRPCLDALEIMRELPSTWYMISVIDGKDVIYEPCFEPPGGFSIDKDAKWLDFWTSGDPFEILSMVKHNNRIEIVYKSEFDPEEKTFIMHNYSFSQTAQFGYGIEEDEMYVSDELRSMYPTVEEECDEYDE